MQPKLLINDTVRVSSGKPAYLHLHNVGADFDFSGRSYRLYKVEAVKGYTAMGIRSILYFKLKINDRITGENGG